MDKALECGSRFQGSIPGVPELCFCQKFSGGLRPHLTLLFLFPLQFKRIHPPLGSAILVREKGFGRG